VSEAKLAHRNYGLLSDLVDLRCELRRGIEKRTAAAKSTDHLWRQLHRVEDSIGSGEFLEVN